MSSAPGKGAVGDLVGRPLPADAVSPTLAKRHHEYAFLPVYQTGGFAYNSVADWASVTYQVRSFAQQAVDDALARGVIDAPFHETEMGMLASMNVFWRDKGYGALVPEERPFIRVPDQATALRPLLRKLGRDYVAAVTSMGASSIRALMASAPVQIAKGKGAPLWLSSKSPELSIALHRLTRDKNWSEMGSYLKALAGVSTPLAISLYIRIQQAKKPVPAWTLADGGARVVRSGTRVACKARKVQALPWSVNTRFVPVTALMQHIRALWPDQSNTGTIGPASKAVRQYKYVAALDLSGYDDSVGSEVIDAYSQEVKTPVYDRLVRMGLLDRRTRDDLVAFDYHINRLPMIAPTPVRDVSCQLVEREGGIVSGKRDTSLIGGDIVKVRFKEKAAAYGLSDYAFFNAGDDMIIATNDKRNLDRYGADMDRLGFKETVSPEPTYLMARLTRSGPTGYRYLGRMLLSTINKEVMNEHATALGFAAAVAVRHELLAGHPLQHVYLAALLAAKHPRVTAAVLLARSRSVLDLSIAYANELAASNEVQQAELFAELISRAGLDSVPSVAAALAVATGRHTLSYSELDTAADAVGVQSAERLVRKHTFSYLMKR